MSIISNYLTIIDRQKAYGVYKPEEFTYNPYNTAYWSGHLIEELLELEGVDWYSANAAEEAADVIIFLQNLTAYLYPFIPLSLDLSVYYGEHFDHSSKIIFNIRRALPNRKSWKPYFCPPFEDYYKQVVIPVLRFISNSNDPSTIEAAYYTKEKKNETRNDWQRDPNHTTLF